MSFKIATDTSSNLTYDLVKKFDIELLPITYIVDGEEFLGECTKDSSNLKQVYEKLRNKANILTSCINEHSAMERLEPIVKAGNDLLYVSLSSTFSLSAENVKKAIAKLKEKYPERKMFFVDTLNGSFGEGIVAVKAAELRENGKTIEEVYETLEKVKFNACTIFTVDSFNWLKKSGRVSPALCLIGNTLNLKPLLKVDSSCKVVSIGKKIGRKPSLNALAEALAKNIDPKEQTVYIAHGDCEEDLDFVKSKIKEFAPQVNNFVINYMEYVIGSHTGPGVMALFYYGKGR